MKVNVELEKGCSPRLEWFRSAGSEDEIGQAFLKDSRTRAYSYDGASGGVMHYVRVSI